MATSRVAEADRSVDSIIAVEVSDALATFLCVESVVDEAEANVDGSGRTVGWTQQVPNTDATFRSRDLRKIHLPGELFGLCQVLFVSAIDIGGRN